MSHNENTATENTQLLVEPGFWSKTSAIQMGYGVWVNQSFVCLGLAFGFSSVAVPQITAEMNSTLAENAWIASVLTLTSPIGCLICGFSLDRLGRRFTIIIGMIPSVIGWFITGLAAVPRDLIIGRVVTGIGVGMISSPVRTFCTEICLPNMRGVVGVMSTLSLALGLTLQATFGSIFKWRTLCYIGVGYSTFLGIMHCFLPESPHYVLLKGTIDETRTCLKKFRGETYDIELEIAKLAEFKETNKIHKLSTKEEFRRLLTPPAYKPFVVIFIYSLAGQYSGITVLTFWAVNMLKDANSAVNPYTGNIMFGMTRFFAGLALAFFIYKFRRRTLAICSSVAVAVLCTFLGIFLHSTNEPSLVPLITFMLYIVVCTFGYLTLPNLILYELIPLEIRGLLSGISVSCLNLMIFSANTLFPYFLKWFGYPPTLMGFGMCSLACSVYLYFFLPETKGKTLQEIEQFYKKKTVS